MSCIFGRRKKGEGCHSGFSIEFFSYLTNMERVTSSSICQAHRRFFSCIKCRRHNLANAFKNIFVNMMAKFQCLGQSSSIFQLLTQSASATAMSKKIASDGIMTVANEKLQYTIKRQLKLVYNRQHSIIWKPNIHN